MAVMHKNHAVLLKEMEKFSSMDEFTKLKLDKESSEKESIDDIDNDESITKTEAENKIDMGQISSKFLAKDPDNHSPEYLAEVRKYTKEISIMIKNIDDKILDDIKDLNAVYHLTATGSEEGVRLTIAVDKFGENNVNRVIKSIVKNNGNIISINTKDPSLEDVFIDVTGKKTVDQNNIKNIEL